MRRWIKALIIGASAITMLFAVISAVLLYERFTLDFSLDEYGGRRKTPASGELVEIPNKDYNRDAISKSIDGSLIFPESICEGHIAGVFFYDPLFANRSWKRGQAYLEWSMDEELFQSECVRIAEVVGGTGSIRCTLPTFSTVLLSWQSTIVHRVLSTRSLTKTVS